MNPVRFDRITKLFADRKISRRAAVVHGGTGLAAGALAAAGLPSVIHAQDATPAADTGVEGTTGPEMLFVQSFQQGTIAPTEGAEGRYTLTLEQGAADTIYFSNRPDRIVGTSPTAQFLEALGFPDDNPPNAALIVQNAQGESTIAVVELFNPAFDASGPSLTYEVEVLEDWQESQEIGLAEAPVNLAELDESFESAHLFIDDCTDADIHCMRGDSGAGTIPSSEFGGHCYSWGEIRCLPCNPWDAHAASAENYWAGVCNERFDDCSGECWPTGVCSEGFEC